jgi:hypothetical protein
MVVGGTLRCSNMSTAGSAHVMSELITSRSDDDGDDDSHNTRKDKLEQLSLFVQPVVLREQMQIVFSWLCPR